MPQTQMRVAEPHIVLAIKFICYALAFEKDLNVLETDLYESEEFNVGWDGEKYIFDYHSFHAEWRDLAKIDLMKVNKMISPQTAYELSDTCYKSLGL